MSYFACCLRILMSTMAENTLTMRLMTSSTSSSNNSVLNVSAEECITINFYGGIEPIQVLTNSETDLTCENVIEICINYIKNKVYGPEKKEALHGPKYLPTFGLVACPEEKIWIPLNYIFKKSTEKPQRYKFRVRFRPPADQLQNNVMCEYLFIQTLHDFLKGDLGKDKRLESKNVLFDLLQIALMIPTTLPLDSTAVVNEGFKSRNLKMWNFTRYFSKEIARKLITYPIVDHYWVNKVINASILKLKKNSPPALLESYKKCFYKLLMQTVPNYCFEAYRVTSVTNTKNEKVTVRLGLYKESDMQDALYYGEHYICSLKEIFYIKLVKPKDLSDKKWSVEIANNGPLKILLFGEEGAAESFITMVQGYINLCIRYDICLCKELRTTGSRISAELRSFGPLGHQSAEKYLENHSKNITDSSGGLYLIHESLDHFGQFEVVCMFKVSSDESQSGTKGAIRFRKYGTIEQYAEAQLRLKMDEKEITFGHCIDLRRYLTNENGQQVWPVDKACSVDINEEFKGEIEYYGPHTSHEDVQNAPSVSLPVIKEDLTNLGLINDLNPVIKKYEVYFKTEKMMLMELQSEDGAHAKSFREGLEKLLKLYRINKSYFLKFNNLVLNAQFSVLMEYVPLQDTLTYICEHCLTVAQKVNIMYQIVQILNIMDQQKVFHGNLRLRKFMTFHSQEAGFVKIKLGDPGISSYFDTLPLEKKENVERVPWLAPERRENLKKITSVSEVYAVGTTFCELLYRTDQFEDELQLEDGQTILTYLQQHKHLPVPPFLADSGNDSTTEDLVGNALVPEARQVFEKVWSIILRCWAEEDAVRPTVMDLLVELRDVVDMANAIQGDTVSDQLKEVVYNIGIPEKDMKKGGRKMNTTELCSKFDNYMKEKRLLVSCIDMKDYNELLGFGNFGSVWKGFIRQAKKDLPLQMGVNHSKQQAETVSDVWTPVAVKRLKACHATTDKTSLYKEVVTSCELDHPNIVKLRYLGLGLTNPPGKELYDRLMLIMEFMNEGNLSKYAFKLGDLKSPYLVSHMLRILLDVAEGMVYLSGKSIVHRDLAARNILLCRIDSGTVIAKVSDFGLARVMEENYRFYQINPKDALPFAWMPPECLVFEELEGKFSSQGDVWSFGTVMWEAFSKGENPRKNHILNIEPHVLLQMYKKDDWRLPKGSIDLSVYSLMRKCWDFDPRKRPAFVEVVQMLKSLLPNT